MNTDMDPARAAMDESQTLIPWMESLDTPGDSPAVLAFGKEDIDAWSYRRLADEVDRLARGFDEHGVRPDDHIVLLAPSSPEWVVACLAAIRAGAVPVPLDVQMTADTLAGVVEDCEPRVVVTTREHQDRLEGLERAPSDVVLLDGEEDDERGWSRWVGDTPCETRKRDPDDHALMFYTSGTTGPPKGVPLSHRNLAFQLNLVLESKLLKEEDRVLVPLPLHHVYPLVIGVLAPLRSGLPVVLPYGLTGPEIIRALREGEVTVVIGVPRLYRALLSGIEAKMRESGRLASTWFETALRLSTWVRRKLGLRAGRLLLRPLHRRFGARLRVVASGGSTLDPGVAWKLEGLGWQVAIGYGLTETSPLLALNPPGSAEPESVGKPVSGIEIRIDKSADGDGQGEIVARGPSVFSGYHNLPEKTDEAFTDDGWFRTGDLGYFDDEGYLHVVGRASTLIVTESGENVQPEAVEEVYAESRAIREIGVLERDRKLIALVVPDTDVHGEDDDVRKAVQDAVDKRSRELPSYQRISEFSLTREPLPRTRLGKIRRHKLEERYEKAEKGEESAEARPVSLEEMSAEDRELLTDPAAKTVWDLLAGKHADKRLTPDTSPQLDLGMDSLEWLNLSLEIGERAGVELDDEAIGRIGNVRDLLREVSQKSGQEASPTDPLDEPEAALSDLQMRHLETQGPVRAVLARTLHAFSTLVMRCAFRVRAAGVDRLPADGPVVLTPNHTSYLDPFALAAVLDYQWLRRTYWAGWTGVAFNNPVNRFISRLARVVPVDPDHAVKSSLAFGAVVLRRGDHLVWFPEGRRSPGGELQEFQRGIGLLLERYPATVVPVSIDGAHEALAVGRFWPRLRRITVTFGEPVESNELEEKGSGDEPPERIVNALRTSVAELAH